MSSGRYFKFAKIADAFLPPPPPLASVFALIVGTRFKNLKSASSLPDFT